MATGIFPIMSERVRLDQFCIDGISRVKLQQNFFLLMTVVLNVDTTLFLVLGGLSHLPKYRIHQQISLDPHFSSHLFDLVSLLFVLTRSHSQPLTFDSSRGNGPFTAGQLNCFLFSASF